MRSAETFLIDAWRRAIAAIVAPLAVRGRFEETIAEMHDIVDEARGALGPLAAQADPDRFKLSVLAYAARLQGLIDTGSSIVHGTDQISDQSAIDAMF